MRRSAEYRKGFCPRHEVDRARVADVGTGARESCRCLSRGSDGSDRWEGHEHGWRIENRRGHYLATSSCEDENGAEKNPNLRLS